MPVTLSTLRTRARQRADMENSTFVSDTELNRYINAAGSRLHDLITKTHEDYYLTSTQFTLSSQNTFALPTTFYKLRALDYSDAGVWTTLRQFNFADRNKYSSLWSDQDIRAYRVMQNAIFVLPETNYAGTYRLWYLLRYVPLSSDSDQLDDLWIEFVEIDAAIQCLQKEQSDTSVLMQDKMLEIQRITELANKRDLNGPRTIADTRQSIWRDDEVWR